MHEFMPPLSRSGSESIIIIIIINEERIRTTMSHRDMNMTISTLLMSRHSYGSIAVDSLTVVHTDLGLKFELFKQTDTC